jgi:hypothetical protein
LKRHIRDVTLTMRNGYVVKEYAMKTQQAVTGRPMWQVSLVASMQRGEKRLKRGWARVFKAMRPVLSTNAFTDGADVAA